MLATLPSYLGHHDLRSKIIPLPIPRELPQYDSLDSMAQRFLQQTFNVPMTLYDIKRFKPQLWSKLLKKMDVHCNLKDEVPQSKELCKVSTYAKAEEEKGNTTLKIKKDTHHHLAIFDIGG